MRRISGFSISLAAAPRATVLVCSSPHRSWTPSLSWPNQKLTSLSLQLKSSLPSEDWGPAVGVGHWGQSWGRHRTPILQPRWWEHSTIFSNFKQSWKYNFSHIKTRSWYQYFEHLTITSGCHHWSWDKSMMMSSLSEMRLQHIFGPEMTN